jgi:hypothetical protein
MQHLFVALICLLILARPFSSHADGPISIPSAADQAYCREIAALALKYGTDGKLPDTVTVEGIPCPSGEAAKCLLAIMENVMEKCNREGKEAIPKEDIDRIATLHQALRAELAQMDAYLRRQASIEEMFARPENPALEYKIGVNGFLRGEAVGNFRLPDFSYQPGHGEGRFLYRVKPYAYWHPTDWLDMHVEGQGYGFIGGNQEFSRYSLYQGYVEAHLPGSDLLALKAGRQEFNYGSAFVLGTDAFYDGLTFDAARLRVKPLAQLTVDLLGGAYARPWSGGISGNLAGGYATYAFSEGNAVEAYYFRTDGSVVRHDGEYLNVWGIRGTAALGPVTLEIEPVYESGRIYGQSGSKDTISAYGGHLDMNVDTTMAGIHNHLFASFALGSGSKDAANGITTRKEFRTSDNSSSLVGDMHVLGDMSGVTVNGHRASGLQIFTLGWGIDLTKELNFSATGRYFNANSVEDGFPRHLGLETDFTLTWTVSDGLTLTAGYDRFFTGGFFRAATGSGKDIDYGYLMLQFDLSHAKPKAPARKG